MTVQASGGGGADGAVFHWTQVKSGQVMHATVHKVNDFGLVVKLSPKIKAVCPSLHASDVGMTAVQLKKKFKTGQVIKVRVCVCVCVWFTGHEKYTKHDLSFQ